MIQFQTIVGFFDQVAEAQQAVQLLLARGFTRETVELSAQTSLNTTIGERPCAPTKADSSSGRFLSSLFSSSDEIQSRRGTRIGEPARLALPEVTAANRSGTLVTVQTQSIAEAQQIADLLDTAGAEDVALDNLIVRNRVADNRT